ncbi:MAG: DUF4169 family protein [Beijerinckiaceae bacterium]
MTDVVNLNRFRKAKNKQVRETQAQENRAVFGRTKAEKELAKARTQKAETLLDGHRLPGGHHKT